MSTSIKDRDVPFQANGKRYLCTPAVTGRSSCKGCKSKIEKGELRFGSSQEGAQHGSIFWKCLPCVTAVQLGNAHSTYGSTPGNYVAFPGVSLLSDTDTALVVDTFSKAEGV